MLKAGFEDSALRVLRYTPENQAKPSKFCPECGKQLS